MPLLEILASFSGIMSSMFIAAGAMFVAMYLMRLERQQRRAATATLLSGYTDKVIFPRRAFELLSAEQFVSSSLLESAQEEARRELVGFMNALEYIAILIRTGTIDESLSRQFMGGTFPASFRMLFEHIVRLREKVEDPRLYAELEALARRWSVQQ